jgi:exodeoxyribonuclease VII small subunit
MNPEKIAPETPFIYEKAIARLEEILQKMSAQTIELDQSLALYEEADLLLKKCSQKLAEAETKIEMLIKNRGKPPTFQEFNPKP